MRKSSRVISTLLLGATLTTMSANVFAVESSEAIKTKVLAGKSRYETAIEVSKHGWKAADTVVLVNAYAIPDALAATPMAKIKKAPILLTEANALTASTKAELERLKTKNVVIVGGEGVVSKEVAKALKDMKIKVERVSGVDRIETAIEVAKKVNANKIAVVNGRDGLADALSVAAPAAKEGMAIILSNKDDLGASEKYIKSKDFERTYIVGGEGVVSKAVEAKLEKPERLAGTDRNETNAEVIEEFYEGKELDNIYLAKDGKVNESELVDALAAGPLAGRENSPVVLVGSKLSAGQKEELAGKVVTDVYEVGFGVNANTVKEVVDALTIREVEAAIESAKPVDVNKIEVKFNRAVDTKLAKFELLLNKADKTTEKVTVKVTFNEAKTAATLETTGKLVAGNYTLNVSGLTEKPLTSAIKVEAEAYKEIKVNAESMQLKTINEIPFQVLNQYGLDYDKDNNEIFKNNIVVNAYNETQKTSLTAEVKHTKEKGLYVNVEGRVNTPSLQSDTIKLGDNIKLTFTIGNLVKQVTLPVVDKASAASIELKSVSPLEGTERITVGDKGLEIPYAMKDQYGNDMRLPEHFANKDQQGNAETIGRVQFTSTDAEIIDVDTFQVNGEGKLTFNVGAKSGDVTIKALTLDNGKQVELKVTVNAMSQIANMELVNVVTNYEKNGTSTIDMDNIKLKDQYGNECSSENLNLKIKPLGVQNIAPSIKVEEIKNSYKVTGLSNESIENKYEISVQKNGTTLARKDITLKSVPTSAVERYEIKSSLATTMYVQPQTENSKYVAELTLEGFAGSEKVALDSSKPAIYSIKDVTNNAIKLDGNKIWATAVGEATIHAHRELGDPATKVLSPEATLKVSSSQEAPHAKTIKFVEDAVTMTLGEETFYAPRLEIIDQYGVKRTELGNKKGEDAIENAIFKGTFSSSNTNVANIGLNGKVEAKAAGKSTITFITTNNNAKASCKLTVIKQAQ